MSPLINGTSWSWANITVVLFGVPVIGITEIEYKRKMKKENNYGFGQVPVSRGFGNIEFEASLSLYQVEWKRIIAAAPNRDPLYIPQFDIIVTYGQFGTLGDKDVLRGVEFMEDPFEAKQGDTKLIVKIPLIVAQIDK